MGEDMRNRFEKQLEQLNNELIEMGNMIEHAIQSAVAALIKEDMDHATNIAEWVIYSITGSHDEI